MSEAAKLDLSFYRGDDYTHVFDFETDAGVAIPITGRTYAAQIRKIRSQAIADATFTCTVTNGVAGELTIVLTNTDTDLDPGEYFWDMEETVGSSSVTIMAGKVTVIQDVTR